RSHHGLFQWPWPLRLQPGLGEKYRDSPPLLPGDHSRLLARFDSNLRQEDGRERRGPPAFKEVSHRLCRSSVDSLVEEALELVHAFSGGDSYSDLDAVGVRFLRHDRLMAHVQHRRTREPEVGEQHIFSI